jgi:putative transposase
VLAASRFHGEGYRKLWVRVRASGTRTSPSRVPRVMRENALLAHQRPGAARGPRAHDGTTTTGAADEMWGIDLKTVMTGERSAAVFVAVDHCSAECVGMHASHRATRHEALEPLRQAVRSSFSAIGLDVAAGVTIRHYLAPSTWAATSKRRSGSWARRVRPPSSAPPNATAATARFIRTLKENVLWVRWFEAIEELRQALLDFQRPYNGEWIIQRHGFRAPAQVRRVQTTIMQTAA